MKTNKLLICLSLLGAMFSSCNKLSTSKCEDLIKKEFNQKNASDGNALIYIGLPRNEFTVTTYKDKEHNLALAFSAGFISTDRTIKGENVSYQPINGFCGGCEICLAKYEQAGLITITEIKKTSETHRLIKISLTPEGSKYALELNHEILILVGKAGGVVENLQIDGDNLNAECDYIETFTNLSPFMKALNINEETILCAFDSSSDGVKRYRSLKYRFKRTEDKGWGVNSR